MSEHIKYYIGPLTQVLSLWGFYMGSDYVWIAIAWLPFLALLDSVLPPDLEPRKIKSQALAYIPIWLSALLGPALYVALAWALAHHDLSAVQIAAAVTGTAWLSVLPLVSASHELYHARGRIGKAVGRYVQVCYLDPTRMEAHVVGHHIDVGTPEDSDTARRGETLYTFSPRAVVKSTIQAQKIMCDALERKGQGRWSIGHPLWRAILSQLIFQSLLRAIGGWAAVAAALGAMLIARFWIESFNYFQHYGQVRAVGAPIEKRHVWNHFGTLSRLCAFEITNHADHHLNSYQTYFELKPHADSVRMPSVFICFFAALVPPIWFRCIIKPGLKQWDLQYANAEERQLAAAQNRKAGWEDWFSEGVSTQCARVSHASNDHRDRHQATRSLIKSFSGGRAKPKSVVEIRPQGIRLELASGETILQAALAQGVPYPHNCTVGTCGSCKTHLTSGAVQALSDFGYTLSKQELDAGFILACQAVPREALTVVEIADPGADLPAPEAFNGRLVSTDALTHDIVKMVIECDRPLKYVAGQCATFKLPGMPRGRNYSFADAPQRIGSKTLVFFVRKVPGGQFTEALFAGRVAGQTLTVEGPHGGFRLHPGNAEMLCVAGGSGLAPLMSVLEDMRKRRVRRPCTLLFGARTQADLYLLDTIANLASAWTERFEFLPVLSHEPADSNWTGARGWVTDFIARPGSDTAWAEVEGYMCGPPPMIDAGISRLVELGVPLQQIHYDKFTDGAGACAAQSQAA